MHVTMITHLMMNLMCTSSSVNVSFVNVYLWDPSVLSVSACSCSGVFSCAIIHARGSVWASFRPGVSFM